jgi:hypothetical protein
VAPYDQGALREGRPVGLKPTSTIASQLLRTAIHPYKNITKLYGRQKSKRYVRSEGRTHDLRISFLEEKSYVYETDALT